MPTALVALLVLILGGFAAWRVVSPESISSTQRVERFHILPPNLLTVGLSGDNNDVAISPDGSHVVYTTTGGNPFRLYARAVDALDPIPLVLAGRAVGPFISPDNAWVGFFDDTGTHTLKKVGMAGGPLVAIGTIEGGYLLGASWGEDDTIIFGTAEPSGLWRIPASGGEPEELTAPATGDTNHAFPHFLPGGRALLFTISTGPGAENRQLALLNLDSGQQDILGPTGSFPRYSRTGHIIYGFVGTLRAVAFDLDRLRVTNPNPVPVLDGVSTKPLGAANFDLAADGSLVFVSGVGGTDHALVLVDRDGREAPLDIPARLYGRPRLSPSGDRLAVDVEGDIWILDLAGKRKMQLTTDLAPERDASWTPDGGAVLFHRVGLGLFRKAADGTGTIDQLLSSVDLEGFALSPTGDAAVVELPDVAGGGDLYTLSLAPGRTPEVLLA